MRRLAPFVIAAGLLGSSLAMAVQPDEVLPNAALEQRARQLSAGLRCLVCQNQSIDDSDAPLARDLRILVRERLVAGDSDEAVTAFVVARYGDFVLLKPPFNIRTALLWGAPFMILAGGLLFLLRRRPGGAVSVAATAPLDEEERRRLAEVMREGEKP